MRFLLGLYFISLSWAAQAEFQVPPLTGPVMDQAGMLSPSTRNRLEGFLRRLYESGGTQLQILTVENLGGLAIEQASIQVTDQWKLGTAKDDGGVLLMVAKAERKVRIEVGQGREGVLPDVVASRIIREVITPRFKEGSIDNGVVEGVIAIVQRTDPEFLKSARQGDGPDAERGKISGRTLELIIVLLFLTFIILPPLFGRRRFGRGFYFPSDFGGGGGFGGGFGGGSSGGGGWGGGGGGFSGGGASGDW